MFDKADLRVPGARPFTKEFAKVYASAANACLATDLKARTVWRKTAHYARSGNFSEYGYPVMLHMECDISKERNHKLEILQTGEKTYQQMRDLAAAIFEGEPEAFGIMRADLTADVPGVGVQWFKENTYIASKQITTEFGQMHTVPYKLVRSGQAETMYAGRAPNQIRIYDKVGERKARFKSERRREINAYKRELEAHELAEFNELRPEEFGWSGISTGDSHLIPVPDLISFDQRFGHSTDAVITRVERQCSGRDLEALGLHTMWSMTQVGSAINLEPFDKVKFFAQSSADLSIGRWGLSDHMKGMYLRRYVEDFGLNEARKFMQKNLGKNFARAWKKYQPFLNVRSKVVGITSAKLQEEFLRSTAKQLAA